MKTIKTISLLSILFTVMIACNSKNKEGKTLREPMLPYNGLTDLEVKSMWAYLQTVPKIKNVVDRKWDQE